MNKLGEEEKEKGEQDYQRELFPVCQNKVYLNNGAQNPCNIKVQERLDEYMQFAMQDPDQQPTSRDVPKKLFSQLFGGQPKDYALVGSTGMGLGILSNGVTWTPKDNIVITTSEHWNNTFIWLNLTQLGVEVRMALSQEDGSIDYDDLKSKIDEKTKIVSVAAVNFSNGYRANLKRIADMAHSVNAIFAVDAVQACGVCPINIEKDDIDVLAAAAFQWLLGLHGIGFLYVHPRVQERINPAIPGMFSAQQQFPHELHLHPDGRKYETGTVSYSLLHAWTAGLQIVLEIGVENIYQRVLSLGDGIISGLKDAGATLLTKVSQQEERSAIISFSMGSESDNAALVDKLNAQGIIISLRGGQCRVSPNFFNNQQDIGQFIEVVKRK